MRGVPVAVVPQDDRTAGFTFQIPLAGDVEGDVVAQRDGLLTESLFVYSPTQLL